MVPDNMIRNLLAESIAEHFFKSQVPTIELDGLDIEVSQMLDTLNLNDFKSIFTKENQSIESIAKLTPENLGDMGIPNKEDRAAILEETQKIIKEKQNKEETISYKTCMNGHQLHLVTYMWTCADCNESFKFDQSYPDNPVWRCYHHYIRNNGSCDYNLCSSCIGKKENNARCNNGHELYQMFDCWLCDAIGCNISYQNASPDISVWRCNNDKRVTKRGSCDYDLCSNCIEDSQYC